MTAYGERSEDVRCPKHDSPLALLEEGVLNGVKVQYWGMCHGGPGRTIICALHKDDPEAPLPSWLDKCGCRRIPGAVCTREVRLEELLHTEPSLFGGEA